jgi:hypothetical protein
MSRRRIPCSDLTPQEGWMASLLPEVAAVNILHVIG